MPIAQCFVAPDCSKSELNICEIWARESGISADEMTVNIISVNRQFGKPYKIMATLYLPTVWSDTDISSIQVGLARALAKCFGQTVEDVHIITSMVESGLVVEAGQEQKW